MKIILQPCGDETSRKNFAKTIVDGVSKDSIVEQLDIDGQLLVNKLQGTSLKLWGVTNGSGGWTFKKWETIEEGDLVYMYRDKQLFYSGTISHKIKNQLLAKRLWGVKPTGETWENIYFLKDVRSEDISITAFNQVANYKENYFPRGFSVVDAGRSLKAALKFSPDKAEHLYPTFIRNKLYNRQKDIHAKYRGQEQGGISTPKEFPAIFLFTGVTGEQYGYEDRYDEEGYFRYTGEGTTGDMQMTHGNIAIHDHEKNGKRIYLFENQPHKTGYKKFIGEFRCADFIEEQRIDTTNTLRKAIVFLLKEVEDGPIGNVGKTLSNGSLTEVRYTKPTTTERKGIVTSRVGQGYYRQNILEKFEFKCAVTNIVMPEILIASHIVPWSSRMMGFSSNRFWAWSFRRMISGAGLVVCKLF